MLAIYADKKLAMPTHLSLPAVPSFIHLTPCHANKLLISIVEKRLEQTPVPVTGRTFPLHSKSYQSTAHPFSSKNSSQASFNAKFDRSSCG